MRSVMKKRNKRGFSLTELMVSLVAFTVMSMAIGSVLVYSWKGWRDYSNAVDMHRDAMVAMRTMAKEIRNSNIDEISGDGDSIDFSDGTTRTNAYSFPTSEIAFSPAVILESWTLPAISSNSVTVAFTLRTIRRADERDYTMTVYPRNTP